MAPNFLVRPTVLGSPVLSADGAQQVTGNFVFAPTPTSGVGVSITRNLINTSTDSPVVYILQDHASDDQPALQVGQDGTGDILALLDGGVKRFSIADGGYLSVTVLEVASTREQFAKFQTSGAGNAAFIMYNGTSANNALLPSMGGIADDPTRMAIQLVGFITSAQDTGTAPIIRVDAQVTTNAVDPQNGTLSAPATRPIFGISANGTSYVLVAADGQVKFESTILLSDNHNSGSQDYLLSARSTAYTIQGQTAATAAVIDLFSKDGDGTDNVQLELFGVGTPGAITNREFLNIYYDAGNSRYNILTNNSGTGTLRPLHIYTGSNTSQFIVDTDGTFHFGVADSNATNPLSLSGTATSLGIYRYVNSTFGPNITLNKSRNATVGSHTIVSANDALGLIQWGGSNGTGFDAAAQIQVKVDGTPGASADMPGRFEFYTTPDGSATPALQMTIKANGQVFMNGLTSAGATNLGVKAGTSTNDAAVGGVLFSTVTAQGNALTGEDQLLNGTSGYTLPANTLSADGMWVKITAWGTFAGNANNKRFRVRFGNSGTNLAFDTTAGAYSNLVWYVETTVIRTGATTQDAITIATIGGNGGGIAATTYLQFAALTQTLSGSVLIQVTGETTTSANNDIVLEGAIIEYGDNNT